MKTKYIKNMESVELHCHKTKLHAHGVSLKDRLKSLLDENWLFHFACCLYFVFTGLHHV